MSTQTTNYKLTKPATTDKYNVTIFNANADIIDTQMKANADAAGSKQPKITGAATTITDANLTVSRALVSNGTGKVAVSEITSTELGYLDGVKSNIQTQLDGKLPATGTAVKATADASGNTITTTYATKSDVKTTVDGINEAIDDINTELDTKVPNTLTVNGKALTGNISLGASDVGALPASGTAVKATADANGNNIANTYAKKSEVPAAVTVDSALSSTSTNPVQNKVIKGELDKKQPNVTGAATTITGSNLTASRALVSDTSGKVAVSDVTSTELGYLDGVTSAIQTQINNVKSTAEGKQNPIKAGTGISIGSDGVTIGHSNSVDGRSVGSATLMPIITFDDQGHITEVTSTPVYPPTSKGSLNQYWRSDGEGTGTWMTPATTPTDSDDTLISAKGVYNTLQKYAKNTVATTLADGLMSSDDKSKLDDIEDGANKTVVDSALSSTSTNPVQNKVVNESIYNLGVQLRGEIDTKAKITVSTSEPTVDDLAEGEFWAVIE